MLDVVGGGESEQALLWQPLRVVAPGPWTGHIPFAFWLVGVLRPDTFVELGTHSGNSYFAFCQAMAAAAPSGRAFAVDTWIGDEHSGRYGEDVHADVAAFNAQHFGTFSTLLRTTFDDARGYFPDVAPSDKEGGIDLLHIDGMHTYEAVRHDFETWRTALSARAVVVFHDINVRERSFGVWRFWHEVSRAFPSFAFDHSNGLGVLGVGPAQAPGLQWLWTLRDDPAAASAFRRRIAARGEAFQWQAAHAAATREHAKLQGEIARLQAHIESAASEARRGVEQGALTAERLQAELMWQRCMLEAEREVRRSKEALAAILRNASEGRHAAIVERDRIIADRDRHIEHQTGQIEHERFLVREHVRLRDEMQAGYEAAIRRLEATLATAREHTAHAIAQSYISTTSWRVTRPLRVGLRLLRGGRARPEGPVLPPLPEPPAPTIPAGEPPPPLRRKNVLRDMLRARLDAFLASGETLRLPRADAPDVSIILVLWNGADLTYACLVSIAETLRDAPFGIEVVIADNASSDATAALLDRTVGATVLRQALNLHFLRAANLAAARAAGRHILLLNNDAQLLPGALASALATLEGAEGIGAVGARIILPDGTLQEAGSIIWRDGACSGYARGEPPDTADVMFQRDVDYCSGAFLLTPTTVWRELGGFDERYAPAYYEETDYCVRLWKSGRRVVYDPGAAILHFEFGSAAEEAQALQLQANNHATFAALHETWLTGQFTPSTLHALAARTHRQDQPRFLVIDDRVPKVELGTGYPRANRLLHQLVAAGAQVAFFPMFRHAEDWPGIRRALDKRIEVLMRADAADLRAYLVARRRHFDAVLVCRPQNMAAFLKAIGPDRSLLDGATILYDAEALFVTRDLQHRAASGVAATDAERHAMIAAEVALTRLADTVISVSPAEQATLEDYGAREVRLLGHALDEAPLPTGFAEREQVVFLGAIQEDAAPNAHAVRWFAADVLPRLRTALARPDLRLTVVGRNASPAVAALGGSALDLLGMVDDLPAALAHARVMAIPSRFAAGIPHKAHQAAMMGIPMVVTSLIAGQLGWTDEAELLVADEPETFAHAVARLFSDEALWTRLRAAALARVRQDCAPEAWNRAVQELVGGVKIIHRLPDGAVPPPPTAVTAQPPNTSRPQHLDWAAAIPFAFAPLDQPAPRIAVLCHMFHTEVAPEALRCLRNLPAGSALHLSTDTDAKASELLHAFAAWEGPCTVRVFPNRGRDIAPKLIGLADAYDGADLVLHLHSKASTHAAFLLPWRSYLYETLAGSPAVVRSVLDAFARLPDLGMVAPQHYEAVRRWLDWRGNFPAARELAARMGIDLSLTRALDFPSGSMFWARPAALRPLLDLNLSFEDFPAESDQVDSTLAHAIERLYFHVCERSGHTWMKVADPALMWDTSTIETLGAPADLSRFIAERGVLLTGPATLATRSEPAPMATRTAPGLAARMAVRAGAPHPS